MKLLDSKDCCGCGSCLISCPFNAIELVETEEGFYIPHINEKKCKNCGICRKKCPIINQKKFETQKYEYYAGYSLKSEILLKSSSGGIFYEIASDFIKNNGIVYGATLNSKNELFHIKVCKIEELDSILKSKYIQSKAYICYKEIEELLKSGKNVLFSGTPCQIESIKSFLGKEYDNFFTIDFICTGVPSKRVYNTYIEHFEKKLKSKISSIDFRNKTKGWYNYSILMNFNGRKKIYNRFFNPLIYLHYNHISVMNQCLKCKFRNGESGSDIQLGDLWNSYEIDPETYNKFGVSSIVVKSEKGRNLLKKISKNIFLKKISKNDLLKVNKSFSKIQFDDNNRNNFFNDFTKAKDKYKIIKKYSHVNILKRISVCINLFRLKIKKK